MYPRRGLPVTGFLLDAIEIAAAGPLIHWISRRQFVQNLFFSRSVLVAEFVAIHTSPALGVRNVAKHIQFGSQTCLTSLRQLTELPHSLPESLLLLRRQLLKELRLPFQPLLFLRWKLFEFLELLLYFCTAFRRQLFQFFLSLIGRQLRQFFNRSGGSAHRPHSRRYLVRLGVNGRQQGRCHQHRHERKPTHENLSNPKTR
jgi:hypothetical protein